MIDFWRALEVQVELAALADSAAIAGASAVDEERYRSTSDVILDEDLVTDLVIDYLRPGATNLTVDVSVGGDLTLVTVVVEAEVSLGLSRILVDDTPLTVLGPSTATWPWVSRWTGWI